MGVFHALYTWSQHMARGGNTKQLDLMKSCAASLLMLLD
jgi:hypothetical protein